MFFKGARSVPWCETEYKGFQRHILSLTHHFGARDAIVFQGGANLRYRFICCYAVWSHSRYGAAAER